MMIKKKLSSKKKIYSLEVCNIALEKKDEEKENASDCKRDFGC